MVHDLPKIEAAWGVRLPPDFCSLDDIEWDALGLPNRELLAVRSSPLSTEEMVAAVEVAEEWDLPAGIVPFMGDFHDVICLDYRRGSEPSVTVLDDARQAKCKFPSFDAFLAARTLRDQTIKRPSGVIESESWLNF